MCDLGFQISKGYVFRPDNVWFWLQSDSGELTYFFYANRVIAMQTYDVDGAPLTALSTVATDTHYTNLSFATELGDGNYLISFRDYVYQDDGVSFTAHYNVYNSSGSLLHSESETYEGGDYHGISPLIDVGDGEVELFSTFVQPSSDSYFLNYFDAHGGRTEYQLLSDRQLVLNEYKPQLLSLETDGFAVAASTRSAQVNKWGYYDSSAEIQFFASNGQKTDTTFFLPTITRSYRYEVGEFTQNAAGNYVVEVVHANSGKELLQTQYVFDPIGNIISELDISKVNRDAPGLIYDIVDPQILNLPDGGWILEWGEGHIGWDDPGESHKIDGHYFQRFDASGTALGDVVTIDEGPQRWFGDQNPDLQMTALAGGGFVATWFARDDLYSDFNNWYPLPMQRVFASDGTPLTKVAAISSNDYRSAMMKIEALPDNGWRVDFMDGTYKEFHLSDFDSAPFACNRHFVVWEDKPQSFSKYNIMYADVDGDKARQIVISTLPEKGLLTIRGTAVVAGQVISYNKLHDLVYSPPENAHASNYTDIGFRVVTGGSDQVSNEARLRVRIMPLNDLPTSQDFTVSLRENSEYRFRGGQFKFEDVEDRHISGLQVFHTPSHGWLYVGMHQIVGGAWIRANDIHKLRYVPIDGYVGGDDFKFRVTDSSGEYVKRPNEVHIDVREAGNSETFAVSGRVDDKAHFDSALARQVHGEVVDNLDMDPGYHQNAKLHHVADSLL